MKKVLITGATSFIGVSLIKHLLPLKYEIYAMLRPDSPNISRLREFNNIKSIYLDMEEISKLQSFIKEIDICVHLAWNGTRANGRLDENLQHKNYLSSIELYEVVKKLGCGTFLGIGSQAEYGVCKDLITENTLTSPNTSYGRYKLKTCNDIMVLCRDNGIRFIWGRVFSIYGKGDNENTLIMSTIRRMLKNENINMTEGTQFWNYLYVEDLAKLLVILMKNEDANGIYNLASDDTRTLREYILELKSILKSESKINFGVIPYGKEGKVSMKPSIHKLKSILRKYKFIKFKDGINSIISQSKNNNLIMS